MNNLFIYLLFGHIAGDFFFQPKSMAVKKGVSNLIAFSHVCIYTGMVILFTFPFVKDYLDRIIWMLIIFIPHYIIDRYSLADKWLKFINGRSLEDFLQNGHKNIPVQKIKTDFRKTSTKDLFEQYEATSKWNNYLILRGGFTCIVYVMVDNGLHLMCLWYGFKLITYFN
jgi:hypothetical protein